MVPTHSELSNKLNIAIEAILYALLAFMPFAFGVVHAWSELIVLLAAAVLLILQAIKFTIDKSTRPVLSWALLPLAAFLLVPVFQLIPLPAGMVKTLSPNTYKTKTELLSKLPTNSSSQNAELKGSNQEAIASGMIDQAGVQELAPKNGMVDQPAVSGTETGLNPSVSSVPSVVNGNIKSAQSAKSVVSDQSKMSLTFYPHATTHGLRLVLSIAIIFLITLQYFTTPQRIKRLLACIAIVGGLVAVLAILQNITRTDKIFWTVSVGHIAEAGPFVNHSNFGQFMNLSIGAALALIFIKFHEMFKGRVRPVHFHPAKGKSNGLIDTHNPVNLISDITDYLASTEARWFWFTLAMIILSAASVFLSLTRGGMLTLLIATAFTTLLLTTRGSIRGRGWIMALMALGAFICVLWIGFDAVYDRLASLSEHDYSGPGSRWQIVKDIATAWTKFPLLGTGLDTHLYVYPMFDRATIPSLAAHAENEYAQLAEEMGLMGLLAMLLFGTLVGFAYYRCIRRAKTPVCSAAYGLGFGLLAILLHSFSDFGQHLPANASLTAIFCALLIILSKITTHTDSSQLTAKLKGSNPEAIASGMIGNDGVQELAPKYSMANQPAVSGTETGLNPSVLSVSSVVNKNIKSAQSVKSVVPNQSTIYNIQYTIICSLLAFLLLYLIFSPQGAFSASSAEKNFTAARKSADFLEELSWQGSAAQFADLLRIAQQAVELQPENVQYRHWLNVWRWHSMSRFTDAAGNLLLPPQGLNHIGRLVDEFCEAIRTCPTYGQSWTVAGQLLYFILEPQSADNARPASGELVEPNKVEGDPGIPEAAKNNTQSTIYNSRTYGASMIRTGYQLAPCDATVCFVTGLLEVTEFQRDSVINTNSVSSVEKSAVSNQEALASGTGGQDDMQKLASKSGLTAGSDVSNEETDLNPLRESSSLRGENKSVKSASGEPSRTVVPDPGFVYFSRCLQLDGRFFSDIAAVYLGIDRPDLVVALAADDIGRLNTTARMLSDSDPNSILIKTARLKVFDLLLVKSESPDVSADTLASLAAIYAKEGKTTEAIDLYRRALTADYGNIAWRMELAHLLGKVGDIETAIKECRIILRLQPNNQGAIMLIEQLSTGLVVKH